MTPARDRPAPRRLHRARLRAPSLLAALAIGVLAAGCDTATHGGAAAPSCEGEAKLCGLRLGEIVIPATHNSFAASSVPGWYFANQTYPIARQLDAGVRGLLIDVHFGVYDERSGRVRTDFAAEGAERNKVVKQVPAQALAVADHVAGGVGSEGLSGPSELYLCHTLCELGADPLARELAVLKSFLDEHPREVVVVIVEDYVPPAAIEGAFAAAGLTSYVATLNAHQPLPTLGELLDRHHPLLVFAEEKGGTPSWYMPAFSFIQDTPLGALHPGQLSCGRYRGEASSPLLLINHWIPPFPPSAIVNAQIGRSQFLRPRITRCMRARDARGAIVAVDFYERTSVVAVARELTDSR